MSSILLWLAATWRAPISPSLTLNGEIPSSSTKYFTKSICPCYIAVKKGVFPYLSFSLKSAFIVYIRYLSTSRLPLATTKWIAVLPLAYLRLSSKFLTSGNSERNLSSPAAMFFDKFVRCSLMNGRSFVVRVYISDLNVSEIFVYVCKSWDIAFDWCFAFLFYNAGIFFTIILKYHQQLTNSLLHIYKLKFVI